MFVPKKVWRAAGRSFCVEEQRLLKADKNLYENERDALKSLFDSILNEDQKTRDINVENFFKTYVLLFKARSYSRKQ